MNPRDRNETSKLAGKRRRSPHEFWIRSPDARKVYLAGSFNGWNPQATPMRRNAYGVWKIEMDLDPGRYQYRFVVDGAWRNQEGCEGVHPGCPHCVPNEFGGRNCVVVVH